MDDIDEGWIKLHRKFLHSAIFKDSGSVHLFIYLLLKANHKEKRFMFNQREQVVGRGQMITGIERISEDTGLSFWQVRSRLELFESENMISRKTTNRFSIITVCNYELYQSGEPEEPQAKPQPDRNQIATNKNEKRFKRIECNDFERLSAILSSLPEYRSFNVKARELILEFLNKVRAANASKRIQAGRAYQLLKRFESIQGETDPESVIDGLKSVFRKEQTAGFDFKRRDPTGYVRAVAKSHKTQKQQEQLESQIAGEKGTLRNAPQGKLFQHLTDLAYGDRDTP